MEAHGHISPVGTGAVVRQAYGVKIMTRTLIVFWMGAMLFATIMGSVNDMI